MNVKYDFPRFDPTKLNKNNINRQVVDIVPFGSLVLELGCATGFVGEFLIKSKKCHVYGVEERKDEAKIAAKRLNGILAINIEEKEAIDKIQKLHHGKFDVILAMSLAEHLKDLKSFFSLVKKLMDKNGCLIITVPNIAHWSIRLSLLFGKFNYEKYGILDETHLHFFTVKSLKDLIENNGFEITSLKIDAEGGGYPKISLFLSRFFPNLFAYQILVIAKIKNK
ncbi:MAG: class I SAM-dependent methyltransferase [Candidatus Levyibacteriota bacterium]